MNNAIYKLYDEFVDPETGELTDPEAFAARYAEFSISREEIIENTLLLYKNCVSDAAAIAEEIKVLKERKDAIERKAERFKTDAADALGGEKFQTAKVAVAWRPSKKASVQQLESLKEIYRKVKRGTTMKEIICTSQAELDALSADYNGRVIIKFGTPLNRALVKRRFIYPVVAWDNSSVEAWDNSSVVARENSSVVARGNSSVVAGENSSVEARGNSSVEAWDNSSVVAWDNSSVEAWDNSSVVAWDNSSVVARGNSSVEAWGNSSVVARENSSVVARGNSQIVDAARNNNLEFNGNARIVYNPPNIDEYIDFYGLDATDTTVKMYKAVHFYYGAYHADYDCKFIYTIGDIVTPDNGFTNSVLSSCGAGIHLAHKAWAISYGANWSDLAILECECEKSDVLVPLYGDGKVRARKAKVLREVPLEECGLYGKIIAKRRANDE
nr:MAG TPA: hypothetical protein [Caudoviricetes sp.]